MSVPGGKTSGTWSGVVSTLVLAGVLSGVALVVVLATSSNCREHYLPRAHFVNRVFLPKAKGRGKTVVKPNPRFTALFPQKPVAILLMPFLLLFERWRTFWFPLLLRRGRGEKVPAKAGEAFPLLSATSSLLEQASIDAFVTDLFIHISLAFLCGCAVLCLPLVVLNASSSVEPADPLFRFATSRLPQGSAKLWAAFAALAGSTFLLIALLHWGQVQYQRWRLRWQAVLTPASYTVLLLGLPGRCPPAATSSGKAHREAPGTPPLPRSDGRRQHGRVARLNAKKDSGSARAALTVRLTVPRGESGDICLLLAHRRRDGRVEGFAGGLKGTVEAWETLQLSRAKARLRGGDPTKEEVESELQSLEGEARNRPRRRSFLMRQRRRPSVKPPVQRSPYHPTLATVPEASGDASTGGTCGSDKSLDSDIDTEDGDNGDRCEEFDARVVKTLMGTAVRPEEAGATTTTDNGRPPTVDRALNKVEAKIRSQYLKLAFTRAHYEVFGVDESLFSVGGDDTAASASALSPPSTVAAAEVPPLEAVLESNDVAAVVLQPAAIDPFASPASPQAASAVEHPLAPSHTRPQAHHGISSSYAEVLDQYLAEQPHRHRAPHPGEIVGRGAASLRRASLVGTEAVTSAVATVGHEAREVAANILTSPIAKQLVSASTRFLHVDAPASSTPPPLLVEVVADDDVQVTPRPRLESSNQEENRDENGDDEDGANEADEKRASEGEEQAEDDEERVSIEALAHVVAARREARLSLQAGREDGKEEKGVTLSISASLSPFALSSLSRPEGTTVGCASAARRTSNAAFAAGLLVSADLPASPLSSSIRPSTTIRSAVSGRTIAGGGNESRIDRPLGSLSAGGSDLAVGNEQLALQAIASRLTVASIANDINRKRVALGMGRDEELFPDFPADLTEHEAFRAGVLPKGFRLRMDAADTAFVTFTNAADAQEVLQQGKRGFLAGVGPNSRGPSPAVRAVLRAYGLPKRGLSAASLGFTNLQVQRAPEPSNTIWSNSTLSAQDRWWRPVVSGLLLTLVVVIASLPAFIAAAVANLIPLTGVFDFLGPLLDLGGVSKGILTTLLPAVLVQVVIMLLRTIVTALAKLRGLVDGVEVDLFTSRWWFMASFISVVVSFTVAGTVLGSLGAVVKDPSSVLRLLAASLPEQSSTFISYVILTALQGWSFELLRPFELWIWGCVWRPRDITTRRYRRHLRKRHGRAPSFKYVPSVALVLCATILYAFSNPVILVPAFGYMLLSAAVTGHQSIVLYHKPFEAGGLFFRQAVSFALSGLFFAQLVYAFFFFARDVEVAGYLTGVLLVVTVAAKAYWRVVFDRPLDHLPPPVAATFQQEAMRAVLVEAVECDDEAAIAKLREVMSAAESKEGAKAAAALPAASPANDTPLLSSSGVVPPPTASAAAGGVSTGQVEKERKEALLQYLRTCSLVPGALTPVALDRFLANYSGNTEEEEADPRHHPNQHHHHAFFRLPFCHFLPSYRDEVQAIISALRTKPRPPCDLSAFFFPDPFLASPYVAQAWKASSDIVPNSSDWKGDCACYPQSKLRAWLRPSEVNGVDIGGRRFPPYISGAGGMPLASLRAPLRTDEGVAPFPLEGGKLGEDDEEEGESEGNMLHAEVGGDATKRGTTFATTDVETPTAWAFSEVERKVWRS